MKKQNFDHWTRNAYTKGILLFAQSLYEGLFYYSFESYRMSALNSHFICYDLCHTADNIQSKMLMDGNFLPISEEFEFMLNHDVVIKEIFDEPNSLLYEKDKSGNYHDCTKDDLKAKIRSYAKVAQYLRVMLESGNFYLKTIYDVVCNNIFIDNLERENYLKIVQAARTFMTELVNRGYSKEYLFASVSDVFFNSRNPVLCSVETITDFFSKFDFSMNSYEVKLEANHRTASLFEKMQQIQLSSPSDIEKKKLNIQNKHFELVSIGVKAIDRYSALESATNFINTVFSLHSLGQHTSYLTVTKKAIVKQQADTESIEKIINLPENPLYRISNSSFIYALYNDLALLDFDEVPASFFRAVALHKGAIDSNDISNKLLNLWTVIEILIDTKRGDNEDKINTICNILCSILNRCYIYSHIQQLVSDLKLCSDIDIDSLLSEVSLDNYDLDDVEKMTLILAVSDWEEQRNKIINSISDYPLIQRRINVFVNEIFESSKSIYRYLREHSNRIKWQIMRIYRNRNMIVHNGEYMPYRDLIVENLHYYVDSLINTIIEYFHNDIFDYQSIYKDILNQELQHYSKLGVFDVFKKSNKTDKIITLDKRNALDLIYNEYRGNELDKAIVRAVNNVQNETPLLNAAEAIANET